MKKDYTDHIEETKNQIKKTSNEENKEDAFEGKLNKHGQIEDEGAPEDEI